ncbi:hypothetical protein BJX99DRAFT_258622 [Aspergillus californicus]
MPRSLRSFFSRKAHPRPTQTEPPSSNQNTTNTQQPLPPLPLLTPPTMSSTPSTITPSPHSDSTQSPTPEIPETLESPESASPDLPNYNDISGAVVVDSNGDPQFLTQHEEQSRQETLERAVRERMLGLPRTTEFSWEAAAGPVLPRYESQGYTGATGVGEGKGGEKGVNLDR